MRGVHSEFTDDDDEEEKYSQSKDEKEEENPRKSLKSIDDRADSKRGGTKSLSRSASLYHVIHAVPSLLVSATRFPNPASTFMIINHARR